MNIEVCISFWINIFSFVYLEYILRSEITGSYGTSIFSIFVVESEVTKYFSEDTQDRGV